MERDLHTLLKDSSRELKRVLAQEDCVLFIGSGISMWSGLPSWSGIIEELARYIESIGENADLIKKELHRGELLLAASYGFDKLTKTQRSTFIRTTCKCGVAVPHGVHNKIVLLGPRCYITTNYDNLLEESLRIWQPDRFYPTPVTNRNLIEMGHINQARSIDFIYKPHGDASDIESIIFTREQYRQLLLQGERHAALDTLKTLMISRPIVYFGFGLRDPDFSYLRDILANTYDGAVRDHYAVMADVSNEEIDYWKRNYGIHLINYPTIENVDHIKDHSAFLELLDILLEKEPTPVKKAVFDPYSSDVILAMARYAATLMRVPKVEPEFHIRVHAEVKKNPKFGNLPLDRFYAYTVEEFLDNQHQRALLIGLPGAGKTYSIHQSIARLAEEVHTSLLSEFYDPALLVLPVFIDLKLYNGNLVEMINDSLPTNLSFENLINNYKVKIYIDSFNEMPKEFREKGSYESDFENFFKTIRNASIIICSRNTDGLDKFNLPLYNLDEIDELTVIEQFKIMGFDPKGLFEQEIKRLLNKPFYFHYIASGAVVLNNEARPRDFYEALFENLSNNFKIRFSHEIDIRSILSIVAFNSLDLGVEAFLLKDFIRVLKDEKISDETSTDIANWLVSTSILTSYSEGRLAFIHQSITEYLAAFELSRQYIYNSSVLFQKLKLNRWDQAIFLTLSLLSASQGEKFLQDIIKADFTLALNAIKYLEDDERKNEIVDRLLLEILNKKATERYLDFNISSAIENSLPISETHEANLRKIINQGGSLGASGVNRLVKLKGGQIKDDLLKLMGERCNDYNLCCNGIGPALSPFVKYDDIVNILSMAESLNSKYLLEDDEDNYVGFICGAREFLGQLDINDIWLIFFPDGNLRNIPKIKLKLICEILNNHKTTMSLKYAGDLILSGYKQAAISIYFIATYKEPSTELNWDSFDETHLQELEKMIMSNGDEWVLDALKCLCLFRQDLREKIEIDSNDQSGILKAIFLYCANPENNTLIFSELEALLSMSDAELSKQPFELVEGTDFDWSGQSELFLKLIKTRNKKIASMLFDGVCPPGITNLEKMGLPVDWVLDWILELLKTDSFWLANQLGGFLALYADEDTKKSILFAANKADSEKRKILFEYVFPYMDITTDALTNEMYLFILEELETEQKNSFMDYCDFLGMKATDEFIIDKILPCLSATSKQPFLDNIKRILKIAGTRHGKRYIFDDY